MSVGQQLGRGAAPPPPLALLVRLVASVCPQLLPPLVCGVAAAAPLAATLGLPESARSQLRLQTQLTTEARDAAAAAALMAMQASISARGDAAAAPWGDTVLAVLNALPPLLLRAPAPTLPPSAAEVEDTAGSTAAKSSSCLHGSGLSPAAAAAVAAQAALLESSGRGADALRLLLGHRLWDAAFAALAAAEAEDGFVAGVTPHCMDGVRFLVPQASSPPASVLADAPVSSSDASPLPVTPGPVASAVLATPGAAALSSNPSAVTHLTAPRPRVLVARTLGELAATGILTVTALLQQSLDVAPGVVDAEVAFGSSSGGSAVRSGTSSSASRPSSSSGIAGAGTGAGARKASAGTAGRRAAARRSIAVATATATATATAHAVRWQARASRRLYLFHTMFSAALHQGVSAIPQLIALWRRIPDAYPLPAVVAAMREALLQPQDFPSRPLPIAAEDGSSRAHSAAAAAGAERRYPAAAALPCGAVVPALRVLAARQRQDLDEWSRFWRRSAAAGKLGRGDGHGGVLREWKPRA